MTLEEMVGQQLMIGVPDSELTSGTEAIFKETYAGGLIVFRPNFSTVEGFRKFIKELESTVGRKLLIAVDHEGGRVIHLAEGITVFPDNLAFGNAGSEEFVKRQGEIEAAELRRLGIDLNLAPTVDVLTETFSPNIGIRSYGVDPNLVAKFGVARIKSMQKGGLSACAKHFPGQGHSPLDAHLGLPVLKGGWKDMKQVHIGPFEAAIEAGVDCIMSSHPVYPDLDPAFVPATFSKRIIQDYLRSELGFDGVILSDDLEMGALRNLCPIGESACRAIAAGHDIVLVCHDQNSIREVFQALLAAYRSGRLRTQDLLRSIERIKILKEKRKERFAPGKPEAEGGGKELAREVAQKAVCIWNQPDMTQTAGSLAVIFPRISELSGKIYIEQEFLNEESFIRACIEKRSPALRRTEVCVVGINPDLKERENAVTISSRCDLVLFFCFDAHLYENTRELLDALQAGCVKLIVIFLRDPFDRDFVRPEVPSATAFGFRKAQIEAIFDQLLPQVHTGLRHI